MSQRHPGLKTSKPHTPVIVTTLRLIKKSLTILSPENGDNIFAYPWWIFTTWVGIFTEQFELIMIDYRELQMEILSVDFEKHALLRINGELIKITPFKERDPSVIKLGIDAPRTTTVNREEVHKQLLKDKQKGDNSNLA